MFEDGIITEAAARGRNWSQTYSENGPLWGYEPSGLAQNFVAMARSPMVVVDVACGYGRDSLFYAAKGYTVIAVDPSEDGVRKAKEAYDEKCKQKCMGEMHFIMGTLGSFRTDHLAPKVDAVLCNYALHMMDDEHLEEFEYVASRILKPGGILLANGMLPSEFTPGKETWVAGKEGRIAVWTDRPKARNYYVDAPLLRGLFSRRFDVLDIYNVPGERHEGSWKPAMCNIAARRNLEY